MSATGDKRRARQRASDARGHAFRAAGAAAIDSLWEHLRTVLDDLPAGTVVSGYWPMRDEVDLRPVLEQLHAGGYVCALPVVTPRGQPLVFRRWRRGDALAAGPFGTMEPGPAAPEIVPLVVLAPLLAFDTAGRRLGYGGGYYDRTLRRLRQRDGVVAVGIAFAAQEMPRVPAGRGDERLDWIVTENQAIRAMDET